MLLKNIVSIRSGVHQQPDLTGGIRYLQASDIVGKTTDKAYVEDSKMARKHLLKEGHVLLAAKGHQHIAWAYHDETGPAVASTFFLVLELQENNVLPEYLAAFLNLPKIRLKLQSLGGGSFTPIIRKKDLENLSVEIPSLDQQHLIINLLSLQKRRGELQQELMNSQQVLTETIVQRLIF